MAMGSALGSASATLELNVSNFIKNADAAGDAMLTIQKKSDQASQGLTGWVQANEQHITKVGGALTIFGGIITGVMGAAGGMAMSFEAAMSAVGSVSGATAEQMERAEQVILDIGYQTTMSATEAAAALEVLIKAGVDLDDALDGIALAAVNLSEATGTDIVLASETAASAMNIFGYEAEEANRVMDAISQSANASALDVNDWALALKYAGPIVAALGWDIEDLAEMMVILGDAGIKGEVGATAIRNILLTLSNPTEEITAAFGRYNVELFDANGNLREMGDITKDLAPAWDAMTQSEKLAFAELVAGKQGVTSFTALMEGQAEAVRDNGNAFTRAAQRMQAAGTTQEMAKRRMDNLAGSVEELKGTVETLAITFMSGLTPVIRKAVDALSGILQLFLRLPGPVQTAIASVVGVTGVLALFTGGSMLAAVKIVELVTAFKALGGTASVIGGVTKAVGLLQAAMTSLFLNPAFLIAIAAIGAAFLAYKTNFLGFGDLVDGALGKLKSFGEYLFGVPETKTVTFGIESYTDTTFDDWQVMEDETVKHAELGVTATGSGVGVVSWVANPDSPDGKDWTLNVDVDGDGKTDALKIISSVNEGGGKYNFVVDLHGEEYYAWYNEATGETIFIKAGVKLDTGDAERQTGSIRKQWQDIVSWLGQAKQLMIDIFNGDWDAIDWDDVLGISKLKSDLQDIYDLVVSIFNFFKNEAGSKSSKQDDWDMTWDKVSSWGTDNVQRHTRPPTVGNKNAVGSDYADPYRPVDGGNQWIEPSTINAHIERLRLMEDAGRKAAGATTSLGSTMAALGATAQRSNGIFTQTASTVGTYRGSTEQADKATGGMATNMGAAFQRMSASAISNFAGMSAQTAAQSALMQSTASTAASGMSASVTGSVLGMKTSSAVQMALMAATAGTTGTQMSAGMTGWLTGAQVRIAASMLSIVSTIRGIASSGYDAGYYAGSMISQGFASGMLAYLGVIRGAASAMVAAASQAVIAKAMIASPSKLFHQYGAYIGEGLERGILSTVGDVGRASDMLIGATLPQPGFAGGFGGGQQVTYIDNSQYFTVTTEEMAMIKNQAQRGNQAADHLIGARNTNGFVGRGGV